MRRFSERFGLNPPLLGFCTYISINRLVANEAGSVSYAQRNDVGLALRRGLMNDLFGAKS